MFTRPALLRPVFRSTTNRALFHTTKSNNLTIPFLSTLPQAPGGVKGDVNEAFVPPPVDKVHGSYHWDFERVLAVSLIPLVSLPLASGAGIPVIADTLLSSVLLAHCYVGFQSCIIDYIPKRVYGKNHNYAMYLLTLGSLFSIAGIYHLETKENGLIGVLTSCWKEESKTEEKK
ncbi:probable Succinate dehydrogenase [ubiquinone] cytochrome b small subunit, mitochondrial [Saccharomycodes ludwigii]|uniref:Succinate dehydrogenase [ubiquinone] cytochrome b small subunit n=1 Tax=Saccharomycodes ludwigii TaxID=36035 RepID=A0A376B6U4_9ASCO|nr:hypothetical protein SCDLUD_001850 [Saccharomycodes ludwigii]KAH3902039.1 hypothetical protein SCDLUD_001850 [Saccharomycodes ludwigii]SSD60388.1 probable Succinate dehydrogenase [ubiquinone] cytochrome b small subunit, mitochondrial [Saccharomycodes ludwigii]